MRLYEIQNFLYHATYRRFVKRIMREGLRGGVRKNWSDSRSDVVYLSYDPHVAESYAESADVPDEWLDHIVILKIDVSSLNLALLKDDENVLDGDSTLQYHGVISPEAISVVM